MRFQDEGKDLRAQEAGCTPALQAMPMRGMPQAEERHQLW